MHTLNGVSQLWPIGISFFLTLARCQGGGHGFTEDAVDTCDVLNPQNSQYLGCFDLGTTSPSHFSDNPPTPGGGANYYPYMLGDSIPAFVPGFAPHGTEWTNSLTPANCTIACRAHGFKYAVLIYPECHCGSYPPPTAPSSTSQTDSKSPCHHGTGYLPCPGDPTNLACGYHNDNSHYFADIFIDITFADPDSLVVADEKVKYSYLGCFDFNSGGSLSPGGITNQFQTLDQCYAFCASFNMPYAGISNQPAGPGNLFKCVPSKFNTFL
jgi:hypothetical protein